MHFSIHSSNMVWFYFWIMKKVTSVSLFLTIVCMLLRPYFPLFAAECMKGSESSKYTVIVYLHCTILTFSQKYISRYRINMEL